MCGNKKFKVDYHGRKFAFTGAKDSYRAGERVTLYFEFIATDTDYRFFVNGEMFNARYGERGYEISFVMPGHDTEVYFESRNTMVYDPSAEK